MSDRAPLRPSDLTTLSPEEATLAVVHHAIGSQVSDIFFMTDERITTVSFRRLGLMDQFAVVPADMGRSMISYVKATAGMDISERRLPLDGRWLLPREDQRLDMRVNTIPTVFGEDLTMRLWGPGATAFQLDHLGFSPRETNLVRGMLESPGGLILVSGPTGTGKTTTLYSGLGYLKNGRRKINTLEDPVEYVIPGIRQSQINHKIGLDFPELLRSVLRQAPDVIMIGEIRDSETAITAVRAANSGHLVLATLHAPVAAGAVHSMLIFGVKPYFLANSLLGVISQRLVRTLCQACRVRYDLGESPHSFDEVTDLLEGDEGQAIYGPGKCDACNQSGYTARTGIFEVMTVTTELRRMIAASANPSELHAKAVECGMMEFKKGAMLKVARGVTSIDELLRALPSEYLGLED